MGIIAGIIVVIVIFNVIATVTRELASRETEEDVRRELARERIRVREDRLEEIEDENWRRWERLPSAQQNMLLRADKVPPSIRRHFEYMQGEGNGAI